MRRTLGWALEHRVFMLLVTLATIVLTVRLYTVVPKGFLPLQDTGILIGSTLPRPTCRSRRWRIASARWSMWCCADPAVASVGSHGRRVERLELDQSRQSHRRA